MSCIVAVEGFQVSHRYVIKEMTILFDSNQYQHFHFNCPIDMIIAPRDWSTIRWSENHNGLTLTDNSFLPYEIIGYILSKIINLRIYTAGNQAKTAISNYLPNSEVVDICRQYNFRYPLTLPNSSCFVVHSPRYCTLSKAKTIKTSLQIFQVNF